MNGTGITVRLDISIALESKGNKKMERQVVLMSCGCVAQGVCARTKKPICIVHDTMAVAPEMPDLTGRVACCDGHAKVPSSFNLAFFKYQPNLPNDAYYCGCWGWD